MVVVTVDPSFLIIFFFIALLFLRYRIALLFLSQEFLPVIRFCKGQSHYISDLVYILVISTCSLV